MIEEFSFGNFRSFKDVQTLNMTAAKIRSSKPELDTINVIQEEGKIPLLKSKAIYGANASGKTNIVKALVTFIRITQQNLKDEKVLSMINSFVLSTETESQPSFFQLIFRIDGVRYRYGFEADNNKIHSEWLYGTPGKRETPFFIREGQQIIELSKTHFKEGAEKSNINDFFRENSLFLSVVAAFNGKIAKEVLSKISSIFVINGLQDNLIRKELENRLTDSAFKSKITSLLRSFDFGIQSVGLFEVSKDQLPDEVPSELLDFLEKEKFNIITSSHDKYDNENNKVGTHSFIFDQDESEGTIKIFQLSPLIFDALEEGRTLVIDEFDARFHPLISKKIISLFNSNVNHKAQLMVITHDTNLLSNNIFRRDQIDFVEKDKYGASHLYTLAEFKGTRNTASFEKDYIQGKYGAIPFLGNWEELFNVEKDDKAN